MSALRAIRRPERLVMTVLPFLLLLGWAALLAPAAAEAQSVAQLLVHPREHDAVVAIAARFPAGARDDPGEADGAAFLLGRVLEEEGTRRLAELSSRISVEVDRSEFMVTMVAPAEDWEEAWRRVIELLEGGPLSESAVISARERHRERLLFEEGAPGRAFDIEQSRYLYGSNHPAARPVAGTLGGIDRLDRSALESQRSTLLRWEEAVIGVVGPVSLEEAGATFRGPAERVGPPPPVPPPAAAAPAPGDAAEPAPTPAPTGPRVLMEERTGPLRAPSTSATGSPWTSGDRRVIDQDVTSTWIMVAWPLPRESPMILRDFLVHLVDRALNPSPPDPGVYRIDAEIRTIEDASVLIVAASVDPRTAYTWEDRILGTLESLEAAPPEGAFFELARRQYRAHRLLEHAVPEERARWMTRRHAEGGEVPRIPAQVWGLTREGISGLAAVRGEPRVLIFGPLSVMDR
ncbi:MAG: insulinase family protein [Gemmatimonadales bacterium]|nr:MAG: insulinase family protein [Gemmatimonadales bacterium]